MCHGDDLKFLCGELIDYAVRKPAKENPASGSAKDGPERWISQNDIHSSLKFGHKRKSKLDICALGVEGGGGVDALGAIEALAGLVREFQSIPMWYESRALRLPPG